MNRRGFFRALGAAPFLAIAAPTVGLIGASFAAGGVHSCLAPAHLGKASGLLLSSLTPPPIRVEIRKAKEGRWLRLPPIDWSTPPAEAELRKWYDTYPLAA